jgi:hypothetical protein
MKDVLTVMVLGFIETPESFPVKILITNSNSKEKGYS